MHESEAANPLSAGYRMSTFNQAVTCYRYPAGIPAKRNPPAAP